MKLIPVDAIPKVSGYHKLQELIEEFVNGDAKIVIDNYLYSIDEIVHVSEGTGSTADKNTEAPAGSAEGNK